MSMTDKQQRFVDEYLIDADRFAKYLDKSVGEDGCWIWTGAKDGDGYGRFHVGKSRNSSMLSHRVAYGLATGESPEAVCHRCDNPSCCNPAHLFGGTRGDNNKDMTRKGRHWASVDKSRSAKGEGHGHAKLTNEKVREIRARYANGGLTQRGLAVEYAVSQRTIAKIVRREGWGHV